MQRETDRQNKIIMYKKPRVKANFWVPSLWGDAAQAGSISHLPVSLKRPYGRLPLIWKVRKIIVLPVQRLRSFITHHLLSLRLLYIAIWMLSTLFENSLQPDRC